jgi:hypothetical protein
MQPSQTQQQQNTNQYGFTQPTQQQPFAFGFTNQPVQQKPVDIFGGLNQVQ